MLLEKIKEDQFAARKSREMLKGTLLTTLYSEALMVGKNAGRETTDEETNKVIQKFLKGVNETIKYLELGGGDNSTALHVVRTEKEILEGYLPKMATVEEVNFAVGEIIASGVEVNKIGIIMKMLKDKFGAALDGKMASTVIASFK